MDIELNNLDNGRRNEEDDMMSDMNWVQSKGKEVSVDEKSELLNRYFGKRIYEARNIGYFLEDIMLMTDEGVCNPRIFKYLIETQDFKIRKTLSGSGLVTNYESSYYGEPYVNENGVKVRPVRNFKTIDGVIENNEEFRQHINDIRYNYDNWRIFISLITIILTLHILIISTSVSICNTRNTTSFLSQQSGIYQHHHPSIPT